MRRPRTRTLLSLGIPLLVVVLLLGAWGIDTDDDERSHRNVTLAGEDVGGLTRAGVAERVAALAEEFGGTEVQIDTGGRTIETVAEDLSLAIDEEATVDAVMDRGRESPALTQPLRWIGSFVTPLTVTPVYRVRPDQLTLALAWLEGEDARQPVEPSIVGSPQAVRIQGGEAGRALDPDTVADKLLGAAAAGEDPITIGVVPESRDPQVTDEAAQALAEEATALTATPFRVNVLDRTATFEVAEMRAWLGSEVTGDEIALTFDHEAMDAALRDRIGSLGDAEPQDARFTVEGGAVRIIPAVEGRVCCAADAAEVMEASILAGESTTMVEPEINEPDLTTAEAEALGVREPVGTTVDWQGRSQVRSFTTYHPCCAARVSNIHRIADLVRGALVLPGETFSVNGHVGQRTREKGFVEAGAIANGEHVNEVGGGVSQFATTLFNAAFFAGLPFGEYQAHSEWFDRYPRGREATMGWEHPDLQFVNDTPYGILIWTSYTDTSITVTLYSTQHAWGEQTGQTESRSGAACTSVTTTRTIHHPDGTTTTDTVSARYRDAGATSCNG